MVRFSTPYTTGIHTFAWSFALQGKGVSQLILEIQYRGTGMGSATDLFHGMENFLVIFPRYGKLFSTPWNSRVRGAIPSALGSLAREAAMSADPTRPTGASTVAPSLRSLRSLWRAGCWFPIRRAQRAHLQPIPSAPFAIRRYPFGRLAMFSNGGWKPPVPWDPAGPLFRASGPDRLHGPAVTRCHHFSGSFPQYGTLFGNFSTPWKTHGSGPSTTPMFS